MKTILLGMNSPTGRVLEFDRKSSAGGRLFALSGMSEMVYRLVFERRNIMGDLDYWDTRRAIALGAIFVAEMRQEKRKNVVVLGLMVWDSLGFSKVPWLSSVEKYGTTYWLIPHTSGRCLAYNDPEFCKATGELLRKLGVEEADRVPPRYTGL